MKVYRLSLCWMLLTKLVERLLAREELFQPARVAPKAAWYRKHLRALVWGSGALVSASLLLTLFIPDDSAIILPERSVVAQDSLLPRENSGLGMETEPLAKDKKGRKDEAAPMLPALVAKEDTARREEVIGEEEAILPESSVVAFPFADEPIQNLPVEGRFYQNVLTLVPGVQDFEGKKNETVTGSRGRGFKIVVDDADAENSRIQGGFASTLVEELTLVGPVSGRARRDRARHIPRWRPVTGPTVI